MKKAYSIGFDIGSTTSKMVIFDNSGRLAFSEYVRHNGKINSSLKEITQRALNQLGDVDISLAMTGSAGMGISERLGIPFVQELIASSEYISRFHPDIRTLIDIGGEDSKIIFFNENGSTDIRMNGSCAGGTGAFIDQISALLQVPLDKLNKLAQMCSRHFPIASRCGVFAKTDVQNLLSRHVSSSDIAASVFRSVALQIKNTLLKGYEAQPKISFSGGPLTFLSSLRNSIIDIFEIKENDYIPIRDPELLPAKGAAISRESENFSGSLGSLAARISGYKETESTNHYLRPLFANREDYSDWIIKNENTKAPRVSIEELAGLDSFLGIDSGSTTTKIVLIDAAGRIAFDYYAKNSGEQIQAVRNGMEQLQSKILESGADIRITHSAVTGYGEELIKAGMNIDYGFVETIAHYRAAKSFNDQLSFILDIGGQDIKAIFVRDGIINNIEINEACSSGCGTFLEAFADSLNLTPPEFASLAVDSRAPCDLGTRCTVFMNSKVKQSYREGSHIEDISAGLAYSVIQNCLYKVLRMHDNSMLGDAIIVQGGTFKNIAVHKAFEEIVGKKVICPDISELMGAYGAALLARDKFSGRNEKRNKKNIEDFLNGVNYTLKDFNCQGCDNVCQVKKIRFENGNSYVTGNKCEKIYSNEGRDRKIGEEIHSFKYDLLFNRRLSPDNPPIATIGIPRMLNMFENFPFWARLFVECGIEVVLSDRSSAELCDLGSGTLMSDNICFPAKLSHGHVLNLLEKGVKSIFYPIVNFEKIEFPETTNCFNCPVVSGYSDVIASSIDFSGYGADLHAPIINFHDEGLLEKNCFRFLKNFGISGKDFKRAFRLALEESEKFRIAVRQKAAEIIERSDQTNTRLIVLAGRPYHVDALVNHNIPAIIAGMGLNVITEDSIPDDEDCRLDDLQILSQWAYPNRMLKAAKWVGKFGNAELVQLNSFGCGPDTVVADEVKEILESIGKNYTLIRIDEHTAPGSLKLRIRSLVESIKLRGQSTRNIQRKTRITTKVFRKEDRIRNILVPFFSPFHSAYISSAFGSMGYKIIQLPPSDKESINLGLKYVNNEICYPATLVIGDILKALQSGMYDPATTAVAISQTGGQCRASNYLPLLKKAMVKAGFRDVPVIGANLLKHPLNEQPGFKINSIKLVLLGAIGLIYGDAISTMYHAIAPREKHKGQAEALSQKYAALADYGIRNNDRKYLLESLAKAVDEFNNIELAREHAPKIGLVGEIYVKYNPIGNNNIVNMLIDEGIEVVLPPLINMFVQWFVNVELKQANQTERKMLMTKVARLIEKYYNSVYSKFDDVMRGFRYYTRQHHIREIAENASQVMNLMNLYFGEGWLIAGDIGAFAKEGIRNVICLQPFGCIANHIIARGVEKKIRDEYPNLNILYLDIDSGASEANLHNRLHLVIKGAFAETAKVL